MGIDWEKVSKEALEKALAWIEAGSEFVTEQAPLVIKEILFWGIVSHGFWVALGLLFLCGLVTFIVKYKNIDHWKSCDDPAFCRGFLVTLASVGSAASFIVTAVHVHGLLYIWAAPRLYLISELRALISGERSGCP